MNNAEKKRAGEIWRALDTAGSTLEGLASELADMHEAERERFDSLSDKAKESERGLKLGDAAEALSTAADKAQEAFDTLQEAVSEIRGIDGVPE